MLHECYMGDILSSHIFVSLAPDDLQTGVRANTTTNQINIFKNEKNIHIIRLGDDAWHHR